MAPPNSTKTKADKKAAARARKAAAAAEARAQLEELDDSRPTSSDNTDSLTKVSPSLDCESLFNSCIAELAGRTRPLAEATEALARQHNLCVSRKVQLGFAAAVDGVSCTKDVIQRLLSQYQELEKLCAGCDSKISQSSLLVAAEELATAIGSKGVARWIQILYNEGDLLDDAGVAAWWDQRKAVSPQHLSDFEMEVSKFVEWMQQDSESDDEGSDGT
eukprot:SAG31_NODE_9801_length_1225_cov_1.414742_1_plen_218_part_00